MVRHATEPRISLQSSLVGVGPSRVLGHCGSPTFPLSVTSSAMSQDTVSTAAPFIVVVSLTFRGRLTKLPWLLINTATWNTTWRVQKKLTDRRCVGGVVHNRRNVLSTVPLRATNFYSVYNGLVQWTFIR